MPNVPFVAESEGFFAKPRAHDLSGPKDPPSDQIGVIPFVRVLGTKLHYPGGKGNGVSLNAVDPSRIATLVGMLKERNEKLD